MILDPVAAYAIKTLDVSDGSKVFINVCTDQQIPPPETLDASEIAMQVMKGKDWIVPIVVSSGKQSNDKAGQPCFVADCCMNPEVVMLGIEDPSVKVLTVETCIELVEDRFSKTLSRDYKFPRLKSKGPLERVEVDETQAFNTSSETPTIIANDAPEKSRDVMKSTSEAIPPKIEIVESTDKQNLFYFHLYRGGYSGTGNKPSHVLELNGEHHDLKLDGSIVRNGSDELNIKFIPSKTDAFYNAEDDTTYVMLWN